eukprot:2640270-Amphidinium_carterae.1
MMLHMQHVPQKVVKGKCTPTVKMVGNIVTRVLDPFRIRIGIGWPEPEPMFWLGENTIGSNACTQQTQNAHQLNIVKKGLR